MKRLLALAIVAALLGGCGEETGTLASGGGGNGSETTNGFAILVVNADWTPASGIKLQIRPSDSTSAKWGDSLVAGMRTRLDTTCDSPGILHIGGLSRGNYAVEVQSGTLRGLIHENALSSSDRSDTLKLQQASTPRFQDSRLSDCSLLLYGFDTKAAADSSGTVQWDTLPVGIYSFRAYRASHIVGVGTFQAETGTSAHLLTYSPSSIVDSSSLYRHAAAIILDASVAGANVSSSLVGFPLPLSLDSKNFDFSATTPSGLRFVSPSGAVLPYAIESWDSSAAAATLWLRLDTLAAATSQTLQLYWGGNQKSRSSTQVFDSSNGWWGVWHLRGSLKDASSYGLDATGKAAGIVGWYSNGTGSLVLRSLPASDSGFTISLWILADTNQRSGAPVIRQISSTAGALPFSIRMGPYPTWIEAHYPDSDADQVTRFPTVSSPGEWLQIAVTYDAQQSKLRLYLNGQQWGDAASVNARGLHMDGHLLVGGLDTATASGRIADRLGFKGLVKEVRISKTVRSPAWISAEYNLQRSTSGIQIQRLH